MDNIYNTYNYSTKNFKKYTKEQIKSKYNFITDRDFKLFNSDFNSDIAKILFNEQSIIIKLGIVSVILFKDDIIIFSCYSNSKDNFINYFSNLEYNKNNYFPIWSFEMILIFISNYIDNYLDSCNFKFSKYNLDNFKTTQYVDILTFQHSLLTIQRDYNEIFDSLDEIYNDKKYKKILFKEQKYLDDLKNIFQVYTNQIKEDLKNLDRLIKQVELFINLASLKLSDTRNKIAQKSFHIGFISLLFDIGAFNFCLFGTNLNSGLENIQYLVWALFGVNIITMVICYFSLGSYYRLVKCCKKK